MHTMKERQWLQINMQFQSRVRANQSRSSSAASSIMSGRNNTSAARKCKVRGGAHLATWNSALTTGYRRHHQTATLYTWSCPTCDFSCQYSCSQWMCRIGNLPSTHIGRQHANIAESLCSPLERSRRRLKRERHIGGLEDGRGDRNRRIDAVSRPVNRRLVRRGDVPRHRRRRSGEIVDDDGRDFLVI